MRSPYPTLDEWHDVTLFWALAEDFNTLLRIDMAITLYQALLKDIVQAYPPTSWGEDRWSDVTDL